jgi:hypothetical protein
MEDVDISFESIQVSDKNLVSIVGVFDGHGGKYIVEEIVQNFKNMGHKIYLRWFYFSSSYFLLLFLSFIK